MIRCSFYKFLLTLPLFLSTVTVVVKAQVSEKDLAAANKKAATDAVFFDAVKAKMLGEEKQEEVLLQKFIKERPEVSAAYYNLASLQLTHNQIEEARKNIEKAVSLDNDNVWYKQVYAEVLKRQGDFEKAANIYMDIAKTSEFDRPLYYEAAKSFVRAKKYKEALGALDKLMEKSYDDDLVLQMKQDIYLQMNDVDGAIKIAKELIERNPKEGSYLFNLAEIYSSNDQSEKALSVYQDGIKKFPDDPSLQYGLAQYYQKQNDSIKYDEYIAKAILNQQTDEYAQANMLQKYLADTEKDTARFKKAMDIAKQLADSEPQSVLLQAFYGQLLARSSQPKEATVYLSNALAIDPARYELWQDLMLVYLTSGNTDSLLATSKRALKYFPANALVYYFNGVANLSDKNYTQAVKALNKAVELQPLENVTLLSDMYSSLGDAYNFLQEYTRSDSCYDKSLKLMPDNPSVLNNYSYYLSVRGVRLGDAEKMSKRSLELRPDEATFLDTYGWVLYKQGKYKEAKEYIEKALKESNAPDGTLFDHLGDVNYRLNDVNGAVENWKVAKEKGTDNKLIDKKIQEKKIYE